MDTPRIVGARFSPLSKPGSYSDHGRTTRGFGGGGGGISSILSRCRWLLKLVGCETETATWKLRVGI